MKFADDTAIVSTSKDKISDAMNMFRTDNQLSRLRNRMPVVQPDVRLYNRTAAYVTLAL